MDTKQLIREDVTRGAAWLDRVAPGWAYTLQLRAGRYLEGVDMFDTQTCVAGHVFHGESDPRVWYLGSGFQVAASKMDADPLMPAWPEPLLDHGFIVRWPEPLLDHGFIVRDDLEHGRENRERWSLEAWRQEAHARPLNVWQRFRVWLADIRRNQVESF